MTYRQNKASSLFTLCQLSRQLSAELLLHSYKQVVPVQCLSNFILMTYKSKLQYSRTLPINYSLDGLDTARFEVCRSSKLQRCQVRLAIVPIHYRKKLWHSLIHVIIENRQMDLGLISYNLQFVK